MYRHWLSMLKVIGCVVAMVQAINPVAQAAPGVEIMPLAVWQGKPARPWSSDLLETLRESMPEQKIAHAVSAAQLLQSSDRQLEFRYRIAQVLRPGDDVLLHFAPWKSIAEKAGVSMKLEPTLFGTPMVPDDCRLDCGLELSVSAFSTWELKSMVQLSSGMLFDRGFGVVRAVYFDQGVVSAAERSAAMVSAIAEDWSGVEMSQLKSNLGRFPVWRWNEQRVAELGIADHREAIRGQLRLDHVRFGIHAEIADMESSERIMNVALDTAKREGRVVRLPIVFNVEDLIHTHRFVSDAIIRAQELAKAAGVPSLSWSALNQSWDVSKIKPTASSMVQVPGEAEFISSEQIAILQTSLEQASKKDAIDDKVGTSRTAH